MVYFAFGVHCHQPLDLDDAATEKEFLQTYRPFLDILRAFPGTKANCHISGPLLEWLQAHHHDFLGELKELVAAGQVEMLASGLYAPVLTLLPAEDRREQVKLYCDLLARQFGVRPRGLWLTGQVWEQHLTSCLAQAGIEYIVLEDTHFHNVGLLDEQLTGYFVTEDEGFTMAVFPASTSLRRVISHPTDALRILQDQAQYHEPHLLTLFADDAALSILVAADAQPATPQSASPQLSGSGRLDRFFAGLSGSAAITCLRLSDALDELTPRGRIYLDNAAPAELDGLVSSLERLRLYEQARDRLKADPRNSGLLRPGYFRNLLTRYPEANRLHKRMLYVSNKLRRSRKSPESRSEARRELFKGQTGDAYLPVPQSSGIQPQLAQISTDRQSAQSAKSVAGFRNPQSVPALYSPPVRQAAYRHLLRADTRLGENAGTQILDFDACGRREIVADYRDTFLVINPNLGGALLELDDKRHAINWLDTITRCPEGYHIGLSSAARYLHYDPWPRYALLDHFYALKTTVQDCLEGHARELYEASLTARHYELEPHRVVMSLTDFLADKPAHLYKEIAIEPQRLVITYDLLANFWQPYRFAVDLSFLPLKELTIAGRTVPLDEPGQVPRAADVRLTHDTGAQLNLHAPKLPFTVWYYPVETIAPIPQSELGNPSTPRPLNSSTLQGTCLVLSWELFRPAGVHEFQLQWD